MSSGATAFKAENAIGLGAAMQDELLSGEERRRDARQQEKEERKKWNLQQKVELDELLPKASGKYATPCTETTFLVGVPSYVTFVLLEVGGMRVSRQYKGAVCG